MTKKGAPIRCHDALLASNRGTTGRVAKVWTTLTRLLRVSSRSTKLRIALTTMSDYSTSLFRQVVSTADPFDQLKPRVSTAGRQISNESSFSLKGRDAALASLIADVCSMEARQR